MDRVIPVEAFRLTGPRRHVVRALFCCGVIAYESAGLASAQLATGRIVVVVVDPSGASVPNATVTISGQEDPQTILNRVTTSATGQAVSGGLLSGRYTLRVDASGFETEVVEGVRVRAPSDVRRSVRLTLQKVSEMVVVGRDSQASSLDPRGFSTFLSREIIDSLPDDPEEFARALRDLAPPGAAIRIDGFIGGSLPPKSQILSIRLPRIDTFAAQDHGGLSGLSFIDIVTRPGSARLQGSSQATFRNGVLDARNPLASEKSTESTRVGALALDGPIVRDLASFSFSARGGRQQDITTIRAALPDGSIVSEPVVQPGRAWDSAGGWPRPLREHARFASAFPAIAGHCGTWELATTT